MRSRATRGMSNSAVTPRVCSVLMVAAWNGMGSRLASENSSDPSSAWRWNRPSRPIAIPALSASTRTLVPGNACDSLPMTLRPICTSTAAQKRSKSCARAAASARSGKSACAAIASASSWTSAPKASEIVLAQRAGAARKLDAHPQSQVAAVGADWTPECARFVVAFPMHTVDQALVQEGLRMPNQLRAGDRPCAIELDDVVHGRIEIRHPRALQRPRLAELAAAMARPTTSVWSIARSMCADAAGVSRARPVSAAARQRYPASHPPARDHAAERTRLRSFASTPLSCQRL